MSIVVESKWWEVGFISYKPEVKTPSPLLHTTTSTTTSVQYSTQGQQQQQQQHTVCSNFRELVKLYPHLAVIIMDKCVIKSEENLIEYDCRLLEDNYYMENGIYLVNECCSAECIDLGEYHPRAHKRKLCVPQHPLPVILFLISCSFFITDGHTHNSVHSKFLLLLYFHHIPFFVCFPEQSPFTAKNTLEPKAKEVIQSASEWKREHPLTFMIECKCHALLKHPLVEAWLIFKWEVYTKWIVYLLLFLRALSVAVFSSFVLIEK